MCKFLSFPVNHIADPDINPDKERDDKLNDLICGTDEDILEDALEDISEDTSMANFLSFGLIIFCTLLKL